MSFADSEGLWMLVLRILEFVILDMRRFLLVMEKKVLVQVDGRKVCPRLVRNRT